MADHSWEYLGRFYGVDATWLAAFNGQWRVDLEASLPDGYVPRIPTAQELVDFAPSFKREFERISAAQGRTGVQLPVPTRSPLLLADPAEASAPAAGNQAIVTSARMRRFSHTGDNYQYGNPLRSPNPNMMGYTPKTPPDSIRVDGTDTYWKCNILVGDCVWAAGYDWPMSEYHRYIAPFELLPWTLRGGYTKEIWATPSLAGGAFRSRVEYRPPTFAELAGVRPGDVVLLHTGSNSDHPGKPGHSGIVTGGPRQRAETDESGNTVEHVELRVLDIYGEQWYDVSDHAVGAIIRPIKRQAQKVAATVGGDPLLPEMALDGPEDLTDLPEASPETDKLRQRLAELSFRRSSLTATAANAATRLRAWAKDAAVLVTDLRRLPFAEDQQLWQSFMLAAIRDQAAMIVSAYVGTLSEATAKLGTSFNDDAALTRGQQQLLDLLGAVKQTVLMIRDEDPALADGLWSSLKDAVTAVGSCTVTVKGAGSTTPRRVNLLTTDQIATLLR